MIEWLTLYVDPGECRCPHDHGARAVPAGETFELPVGSTVTLDGETTIFARERCPISGCKDECSALMVTERIPAGSHGPVLVRVPRAAWPKEEVPA